MCERSESPQVPLTSDPAARAAAGALQPPAVSAVHDTQKWRVLME